MVDFNIFIKTALITTLIFGVGVWVGLWLGEEKISFLQTTITDLQENIDNAEMQFLMLDVLEKNASCNYMIKTANDLGEEAGQLAFEVGKYENAQKIEDSSFIELKSRYTNTVIRDWITLEKIKKNCNGNYSTILYFYSNKRCDDCEEQGIVLSFLKEKLKQDLLVFALDSDLNVDAVEVLKDSYEVTNYPSLVVNGVVYEGFQSKEKVTGLLCDFNANLSIC